MRKKTIVPQKSLLFRLIHFAAFLRFKSLLRFFGNANWLILSFVFISGATALGTITMAALLTQMPLLFPPLGPTAFILFYSPMAESAAPRNVVLAHGVAMLVGLLALHGIAWVKPESGILDPAVMNHWRIAAIAIAMGLTSVFMIGLKSVHPPAAATSLIAAMGYLETTYQVGGMFVAVLLLVLEAIFFNRVLGGLPFPLWKPNPDVSCQYGVLAGQVSGGSAFWNKQVEHLFRFRK